MIYNISALILACGITSVAFAAATPDLQVGLTGTDTNPMVNTFSAFTARVTNIGRGNAGNVQLKIKFPLTTTSPQVYVLGAVQNNDVRCSIINRELVCNLTTIAKNNAFKEVSFQF